MKHFRSSLIVASIAIGVVSSGCARPQLLLEVQNEGDNLLLLVTNRSNSAIDVGSGILDTAKRRTGDLYIVVQDSDGKVIPVCGMITSHERSYRLKIEPNTSAQFREDRDTLLAVHCVGDEPQIRLFVEYRAAEVSVSPVYLRSNGVEVRTAE